MSIHIFVMAGGSGTRLWPLSSDALPKQFLKVFSSVSFFQDTLMRFSKIENASFHVLTSSSFNSYILEEIKYLSINVDIINEPERKNTLAAICYGIKNIKWGKDDYFLVVPCDHVFSNPDELLSKIDHYLASPVQEKIVAFGIHPYKPETGYGYIEKGKEISPGIYEANRFIEKPTKAVAKMLVDSDKYFWNTGVFLCKYTHFVKLLQTYAPIYHHFLEDNVSFEQLPTLSIDQGIMEKTNEILLFPLSQKWIDIGSWDRIYEHFQKDHDQNVLFGNVYTMGTSNSLVIGGTRQIATIGLEDMFIIDTEDVLLIGKKEHAEQVKMIAAKLKEGK